MGLRLGRILGVGVLLLGTLLFLKTRTSLEAQSTSCSVGSWLEETLTGGSRWDLCWSASDAAGIVLHRVHYTAPGAPRYQVLKEASLAQIFIEPVDGSAAGAFVGGLGIGGDKLVKLDAADCGNGVRLKEAGRAILCKRTSPRGYIYKFFDSERQGQYLSLTSASDLEGRLFLTEWRFFDDGTIEPRFGESGTLQHFGGEPEFGWPLATNPETAYGHVTHVFWRLDLDIGLRGDDDVVEEIEILPESADSQRRIALRRIASEESRSLAPEIKRQWRVRAAALVNADGHNISYHLEPLDSGHSSAAAGGAAWTRHQLYVTRLRACERTGLFNQASNGNSGECADGLTEYVDGESLIGGDPVLWFGLSAARLPRAEDWPVVGVQWLRFALIPRDWTSINPLIP